MIISEFRASSSRHYFRCRLSLSPYYSRRLHAPHPSHSQLHRYREMVEMTRRHIHGNGDSADKAKSTSTGATVGEREHHDHGQPHAHMHSHSHSHGIFGGHSHGHGHDGHDHSGGGLIETLQSGGWFHSTFLPVLRWLTHTRYISSVFDLPFTIDSYRYRYREGDRGSRVTLVGLVANIFLTSAKGAAGWYMNSAALLADAGHSLSGKHALPTSCASATVCVCAIGGWAFPSHASPRVRAKRSRLTCQFPGFDT